LTSLRPRPNLAAMPTLACRHCGAAIDVHEPVARDAECPNCGGDQRCCLNCRHYDPNFHNSCRETEADTVEDKRRRNFCEFFSFSRAPFAKTAANPRAAEARSRLESLFGGKPAGSESKSGPRAKPDPPSGGRPAPGDRAADARRKLDALFGAPPPEDESD
jgi:hypothetical protein